MNWKASNGVNLAVNQRIVFLGDSITQQGDYILFMDAYFQQHLPQHKLELINLGVSSETAAGTSEPSHPFPRPCVHERLERAIEESKPDCVFICYGMNDGIYYPFNEELFQAYQSGIRRAVELISTSGAEPVLMTPPPFDVDSILEKAKPYGLEEYAYNAPYAGYNEVLKIYSEWLLQYGKENGIIVVDIYKPLLSSIRTKRLAEANYTYGDGIHPNEDGHWVIARTILSRYFHIETELVPEWVNLDGEFIQLMRSYRNILNAAWREHVGHLNPTILITPPLSDALVLAAELMPSIQNLALTEGGANSASSSPWKGHTRIDFYHEGRECILVVPKEEASGKPWIWRPEFFDCFAEADMSLLEQGWHIAYCRLSNLYGCPPSAELMEDFRRMLASAYGLIDRPALFGFSRGGLYALRYASNYPEHVSAIYLDAPVVDIRSWPGGQGEGKGAIQEWFDCLTVYGIDAERAGDVTSDLLASLEAPAKAGIPILLISGDSDQSVPFSENGAILAQSYGNQGGNVEVIMKPGCDHHPHSLLDVQPIVKFVRKHTRIAT